MPILTIMIYDGRRVLCLSNFRSTSGDSVRLSIKTKTVSETMDTPKIPAICSSLIEVEAPPPDSKRVSATRNETMAADNVIAPLISMDLELLLLSSTSLIPTSSSSTLVSMLLLIPIAPYSSPSSTSPFLSTN